MFVKTVFLPAALSRQDESKLFCNKATAVRWKSLSFIALNAERTVFQLRVTPGHRYLIRAAIDRLNDHYLIEGIRVI